MAVILVYYEGHLNRASSCAFEAILTGKGGGCYSDCFISPESSFRKGSFLLIFFLYSKCIRVCVWCARACVCGKCIGNKRWVS